MGGGAEEEAIRRLNPAAQLYRWGTTEDVNQLLATARALVFPSLWFETHGLVVSEALARGIPVIVSRLTGARDIVSDGVNGLLYEPSDKNALIRCLLNLTDDDRVEAMGRNAYGGYWRDPPTLEKHVNAILDVYRDALSGERRRLQQVHSAASGLSP